MQTQAYQAFIDTLRANLQADGSVLGLVLLGSTAGQSHAPDEWSDHDFFVITESGAQERFRTHLEWLPDHESVVLAVRETPHGLKILYASGHVLEFAVFDRNEISVAKANDFSVVFDRGGVAEAMQRIAQTDATVQYPLETVQRDLGTFLCLLVIGAGRVARGELISGQVFIRTYALGNLLRVLAHSLPSADRSTLDNLDAFRRFERAFPEVGAAINAALSRDTAGAALGLLEVCEQHLRGAASFPQAGADAVRRFLQRFDRSSSA
jgi:hypothetical protein